ncbi:hypothetical protein [Kurthia zopfii]|uniref:hypothetical protein n=1 Tax=Kurthia zopfii TaxID=1650 RepID=UPI000F6F47A5|nr:hypothetical protein [Kurthia zopfii]VEI04892.1 Uncharacterised protein [Kurthia zopfii]
MKKLFFVLFIFLPVLNLVITTSIGVFMRGEPFWPVFSDQLAVMGIYYFLISIITFLFFHKIIEKAVNTKR